ncbi:fructose-bisphosphatase class II family protein [Microbacterium sp. MPKO10]|uniref:fructose-bisphosphatase class II family protein n=1 Tax=Microbacterium sp. MPKO10 TaxID=2989818 RepID=UPI00223601F4|nr:fructose-bisphosphatase class II family protein [Microbacterium sp. MPKO10]MCW4457968.1 fructose-bisphosphatase class II family protein [Microbacterium sp. MPKO10]
MNFEASNRALHDHFLRITEQAAVAASAYVGSGDKLAVDDAAVQAMRLAFEEVPVSARIVVGEGEKDRAPMLYTGEELGAGGPEVDVAVDPVDGTRLAAQNLPGSVAVMTLAPRGSLFDPGRVFYMEKLVTTAAGATLSLERSLTENLMILASELGRPVSKLRVAVQDRPRNRRYLTEIADAGAEPVPFADGDVVESLRAARGDGIDMLIGIGGAPEGVLTSVPVAALGGHMQGRLAPQTDGEKAQADAVGQRYGDILRLGDLAAEPGVFVLSAVTAAAGLDGPTREQGEVAVHSLVIDASGEPRRVAWRHPVTR